MTQKLKPEKLVIELAFGKANDVAPDYGEQFPSEVVLQQNYPNPFNPQTAISFSLLAVGKVTLKVYDMLGRESAMLIDNKLMQAGTHTIQFDGSKLMSGVYFYRISANGVTVTKKLVVMK